VTADGRVLAPAVEAKLPGSSLDGPVLFWQPKWTWTASDSLVVSSPGDTARLSQFNTAGGLIRIIESRDKIVGVDNRMRESLRDGYLDLMEMRGEDETTLRQARERLAVSPQFPRVMRLFMAESGSQIWVQTIASDWNRRWPPDWIYEVYSANGQLLACADMPAGFRPLVATERRMWGVSSDDLGVPHVQAYSFVLPSVEEKRPALQDPLSALAVYD
jgi:hypothetical protein